ncbi:MAG TPA: hypothetical protein VKE70_30900, partial [Candidatus Solibacter sp.]|nr:hypothetical protein [Candidatus Solibacter sp.]
AGIPHFARFVETSSDLWPILALAGALGLLVEWVLYGRFRRGLRARTVEIRRSSAESVGAPR